MGTGYTPHGIGATVLLVVGVKDEQYVQGLRDYRIRLIPGFSHRVEQHVDEVCGIGQFIVGVDVGKT